MNNKIYTALKNLYYSLNPVFLSSLEKYASRSGYNLEYLIQEYSKIAPTDILNYIEDLNNNDSISSQLEYTELIDLMIDNII